MQIFGSDSKLPHLDQLKENDWIFRFFKNKYVCLITTGNYILEKVTPFPWIVQNFKPCHKKEWQKQIPGKIGATIPTKWNNSCCMIDQNQQNSSQTFSKCYIHFSPLCHNFLKYFTSQIACISLLHSMYIVKTFGRQVCLFNLVLSLSNKIKYCSLSYRTPSLCFRLLSLLLDYGS